jgi:hypothetical protein
VRQPKRTLQLQLSAVRQSPRGEEEEEGERLMQLKSPTAKTNSRGALIDAQYKKVICKSAVRYIRVGGSLSQRERSARGKFINTTHIVKVSKLYVNE